MSTQFETMRGAAHQAIAKQRDEFWRTAQSYGAATSDELQRAVAMATVNAAQQHLPALQQS